MLKSRMSLILAMVVLLAGTSLAKKVKTAQLKDNVLTDGRYHYTLNVLDNWKVKTFKEKVDKPEILRALLIQKNYRVNREARDLDADFTIPQIQIFVRPDSISAEEFLKRLRQAVMIHKAKDDIINHLNLILAGEYLGAQPVKIGGVTAIQALFKRPWKRILQGDPTDPRYRQYGGRIVRDVHDVNEIYIFNHDDCLYVIQDFSENEFYSSVKEELDKIISSFKFTDEPEAAPEPK